MAVANRLLDNEDGAAVLEMTLLGAVLEVTASGVIAIAGADMGAIVEGEARPLSPGRSHALRAGSVVRFGAAERGMRAYLALPGGIDDEPVLRSRSTCLAGGFGGLDGRALREGDLLAASRAPGAAEAGRHWPAGGFDPTDPGAPVRIVAVPDSPGVHPDALAALIGREWRISPVGDRTGARLEGTPLPTSDAAATLVSSGVVPGGIQIPASGEPIVLLADAPTIGGYPVPAIVARADLPIVAQRPPGERIPWLRIDAEGARQASRERQRARIDGMEAR
jgi:biotin-dependent carboxylase-like uncharacterized protein